MGMYTGKTVMITGTGRTVLRDGRCGSIGYGVATAYAKEGANLAITDIDVPRLEAAKEELERLYGIKCLAIEANVGPSPDGEANAIAAVKKVVEEYGRIDVLINCAQAATSGIPLAQHSIDQFNVAMCTGLYATFFYMRECYPYLKETKGSVVNFASGAGLFGYAGQASYAAAKEGIRGMSRVAATEWGKDGINVNIVCPLAWTAHLESFQMRYPGEFMANVHMPPMGHYGDPELEIGAALVQITGPAFKYMTGETITLEGGLGQRP